MLDFVGHASRVACDCPTVSKMGEPLTAQKASALEGAGHMELWLSFCFGRLSKAFVVQIYPDAIRMLAFSKAKAIGPLSCPLSRESFRKAALCEAFPERSLPEGFPA